MSSKSYTTCDCCQREIEPTKESWLRLTLQSNQYDNRAFVHLDGKTFQYDGSYLSGGNGLMTFDVCQQCAKRFGVTDVKGNPEFAKEAREQREREWQEFANALDISEPSEEMKSFVFGLVESLGRVPTKKELEDALRGAAFK